MRPLAASPLVSPHRGRTIVLNARVYPLNETIINVVGDKEQFQQMFYVGQQMVSGSMRANERD